MRCAKFLAITSFLLLCSIVGFGQTFGTITGEVKDSSGALVAGASVTVTDKATNASRLANTNAKSYKI